jgi:cysteine dioxygenase
MSAGVGVLKASALLALDRPLLAEFERDPKGAGVARVLAAYAREHADWRDFALFDAGVYTRNLITRNAWYEMLLLCWSAGQESPIHNHAGQNCWMAVLDGEIEEQQFACPPQGKGPVLRGSKVFTAGKVAFINDDIALHRVRPRVGTAGVSLHVYSRPIDTCNVYDEESGSVVVRSLTYHSVRGSRVIA